ncbi:MAG: STAS/SEC14 domain-containing protein [Bacteroidota bacterium]|nr:STAS/SEC14 domain-containing protein [Bacteroidota bacterium]
MLRIINNLPRHVAGVHAYADVDEVEYESTLDRLFNNFVERQNKINFLLVLETEIKNYSPGKWCGNIRLGLKYFFRWNKVVLVTDKKYLRGFSDLFKYILPGQFRSFPLDELDSAIRWVVETK